MLFSMGRHKEFDIVMIGGNNSFHEKLLDCKITDGMMSYFFRKLHEYSRMAFSLRPELTWIEFQFEGISLRITPDTLKPMIKKDEEYKESDGY